MLGVLLHVLMYVCVLVCCWLIVVEMLLLLTGAAASCPMCMCIARCVVFADALEALAKPPTILMTETCGLQVKVPAGATRSHLHTATCMLQSLHSSLQLWKLIIWFRCVCVSLKLYPSVLSVHLSICPSIHAVDRYCSCFIVVCGCSHTTSAFSIMWWALSWHVSALSSIWRRVKKSPFARTGTLTCLQQLLSLRFDVWGSRDWNDWEDLTWR